MKTLVKLLCLVVFSFVFLAFGKPAYALTVKSGDMVVIPEDTVTDDALMVTGKTLEINGHVMGDLICAGQSVTVNAIVDGDVLCAGQNLKITGEVAGNIRSAGQYVTISGTTERNTTVFGQTINLTESADVGMDALIAGTDVVIDGSVARDLTAMGNTVAVNGHVARNADVSASQVTLGPNGAVTGNLSYTSPNRVQMSGSATVSGTTMFTERKPEPVKKPVEKKPFVPRIGWFSMIFYIIIGLLMAGIFPGFLNRTMQVLKNRPWHSLALGFIVLAAMPLAILLLMVTVIGIPVAFFGILVALMAVVLAKLYPAMFVGHWIYRQFAPKGVNRFLPVIIGVPVLSILYAIPVAGGILSFIAMLFGLGSSLLALKARNGR